MTSFHRVRLTVATVLLVSATVAAPGATSAAGTITASGNAVQIARHMATDAVTILLTTAFVARPLLGAPSGFAYGSIAGFGNSYFGVLSTGNVDQITNPAELGSANLGAAAPAGRGATVRDATILRIDFTAGATANCLKFDFKFLSKEVPQNIGSPYNDAFIAELDSSTWAATATSSIDAPGNMAYDPVWRLTSVNTTGPYMSAAAATGTVFDAAATTGDGNGAGSAPLTAMKALTPGPGQRSLYLSIFDQVSYGGDSAVLIDNLRAETIENPAIACEPPVAGGGGGGGFSPGAGGAVPSPSGSATLSLTTKVVGGTASAGAWVLAASGPRTLSGIAGSAAVTGVDVSAGSYRLSVTGGAPTYATSWSCTGATLIGRIVTIEAGAKPTCTLRARYIDPFLVTGTFVIADRAARVGATVTYWSSAWGSRNAPSKGTKVTGFRGYAGTVTTAPPSVGAGWRTTATTSAKPPRTLPSVIAVAVTSSVRKSGTRISGNIVRIVLIRRGSTFGVGKVIAVLSR